jgi:hypothetical protein
MKGICSQCLHSRHRLQLGQTQLLCCCDPPKLQLLPNGTAAALVSIWPPVEPNHDCGKYEPDPMVRR